MLSERLAAIHGFLKQDHAFAERTAHILSDRNLIAVMPFPMQKVAEEWKARFTEMSSGLTNMMRDIKSQARASDAQQASYARACENTYRSLIKPTLDEFKQTPFAPVVQQKLADKETQFIRLQEAVQQKSADREQAFQNVQTAGPVRSQTHTRQDPVATLFAEGHKQLAQLATLDTYFSQQIARGIKRGGEPDSVEAFQRWQAAFRQQAQELKTGLDSGVYSSVNASLREVKGMTASFDNTMLKRRGEVWARTEAAEETRSAGGALLAGVGTSGSAASVTAAPRPTAAITNK